MGRDRSHSQIFVRLCHMFVIPLAFNMSDLVISSAERKIFHALMSHDCYLSFGWQVILAKYQHIGPYTDDKCKCDKVCYDQVMLQKNLEVDDETGYKEAFKVRKMIMFLTKMIKTSQELRMLSRSPSDCRSLLLNLNLNLNRCLCSHCSYCSHRSHWSH